MNKNISTSIFLLVFLIAGLTGQTNWNKYYYNPVLEIGIPGSWDNSDIRHPEVARDGDTLKMWYSGRDANYDWAIGIAKSADGISWAKYPNNPVLVTGDEGTWDETRIQGCCVLIEGRQYKMWYSGRDAGATWRLGYATSSNGLDWTKHESNPVLDIGDEGEFDDFLIFGPSVLFHDELYHMWYLGTQSDYIYKIGYATSPDGIVWTKDNENNPVLVGSESWESNSVSNPDILFNGEIFEMWYTGNDGNNERIGYAYSSDGMSWTKHESNPVIDLGDTDAWDDSQAWSPAVILDTLIYKMWYGGWDGEDSYDNFGYAFDFSLVNITENENKIIGNFTLSQNYPNPFNPITTIKYQLPSVSEVELSIYNLSGQKIEILISQNQPAGDYLVEWNATNFASGIYFYRLKTNKGFVKIRKMILIK